MVCGASDTAALEAARGSCRCVWYVMEAARVAADALVDAPLTCVVDNGMVHVSHISHRGQWDGGHDGVVGDTVSHDMSTHSRWRWVITMVDAGGGS